MTDDGQGLALKGADEVGGAQEDNTSCRMLSIEQLAMVSLGLDTHIRLI